MKLLVFSAPWCGQCNAYHPIINKFVKTNPQLKFEEVNAEDRNDLVECYKVKSLPTTIILDDLGTELRRKSGLLSNNELSELIK